MRELVQLCSARGLMRWDIQWIVMNVMFWSYSVLRVDCMFATDKYTVMRSADGQARFRVIFWSASASHQTFQDHTDLLSILQNDSFNDHTPISSLPSLDATLWKYLSYLKLLLCCATTRFRVSRKEVEGIDSISMRTSVQQDREGDWKYPRHLKKLAIAFVPEKSVYSRKKSDTTAVSYTHLTLPTIYSV